MNPPEVFDPYWHWLGIDPSARPVHHYALLGLPLFEADPAQIAAAADERMRLIRQYQTGPRGAFTYKLLNELATARICLLSPASKAIYDQSLHQALYPPMPPSAAGPPPPKRRLAEIMPPGWSGESQTHVPNLPQPAQPSPRAVVRYEDVDEPARVKPPGLKRPLVALASLGGLLVLIAILGVMFAQRILNPPPVAVVTPVPGETTPEETVPETPAPVEAPPAVVVLQEGTGELNLTPATALVEGKLVREVVGTSDVLSGWSSAADIAEWQFKLVKPGFFELELQYNAHPSLGGKQTEVTWDEQSKRISIRIPETTGSVVRDSHIILIKRGGEHTLTLRPTGNWPEGALQLISVRLIPATGP